MDPSGIERLMEALNRESFYIHRFLDHLRVMPRLLGKEASPALATELIDHIREEEVEHGQHVEGLVALLGALVAEHGGTFVPPGRGERTQTARDAAPGVSRIGGQEASGAPDEAAAALPPGGGVVAPPARGRPGAQVSRGEWTVGSLIPGSRDGAGGHR